MGAIRMNLHRRTPPGPRGLPLLGVFPQFRHHPLRFLLTVFSRYGDPVFLRLGFKKVYLLTHPDSIKHVLQDRASIFRKIGVDRIKPLFGEGLTTSEGTLWERERRLLEPAFHARGPATFEAVTTEATAAMLKRWRRAAEEEEPLDLTFEMRNLTRTIVFKALFGAEGEREGERLSRALTLALEIVNRRVWAWLLLPERLPLPGHLRLRKALKLLDAFIYRMITLSRRGELEGENLLTLLLELTEAGGIDDRQLRDEIMTLLIAGHTTTAAGLTWTWYLLARYPGVVNRLRAELRAVLGGRPPTASDLPALPYTRRVIAEVLRLYPPTWITARTPLEAEEIGGYPIPPGTILLLSPYLTHRHPAFWEEPERFDPDRFLPERAATRPRYAYFPFGGGPRSCLGRGVALMEMGLIIAMVAQSFRLHLLPGPPVEPHPAITLQPWSGPLVRVEEAG